MPPSKKPKSKGVYRAYDEGYNQAIDDVTPHVRMLETVIIGMWVAIALGVFL